MVALRLSPRKHQTSPSDGPQVVFEECGLCHKRESSSKELANHLAHVHFTKLLTLLDDPVPRKQEEAKEEVKDEDSPICIRLNSTN